jgi:hypothetical protein
MEESSSIVPRGVNPSVSHKEGPGAAVVVKGGFVTALAGSPDAAIACGVSGGLLCPAWRDWTGGIIERDFVDLIAIFIILGGPIR